MRIVHSERTNQYISRERNNNELQDFREDFNALKYRFKIKMPFLRVNMFSISSTYFLR